MSFNWGAPSTGVGIFAYNPIIIHKKRIKVPVRQSVHGQLLHRIVTKVYHVMYDFISIIVSLISAYQYSSPFIGKHYTTHQMAEDNIRPTETYNSRSE